MLLAAAVLLLGTADASEVSPNRVSPIVEAVRDAGPSVVNIHGHKSVTHDAEGRAVTPRQVNGMGTGVVIDPRGFILTNYHVVDGVRRINVTLEDGQTYIAKVVAHDTATDLAVIRIRTGKSMPVIRLGSSHDLMIGETVLAVGNAYGYEHTVTRGIVSALHRNVQANENQPYLDLIQTDASINPGNSGGPLLNIDGEMIGVNVAVRAGAQGIGFAIPVNKALEIAANLLSIERLENNWHGIRTASARDPRNGVTVANVSRRSPASVGGLRGGDVLLEIGEVPIARQHDVERSLLGRRAGETVPVLVERNGNPVSLQLKVARLPSKSQSSSSGMTDLQRSTWETLGLVLQQEPSSSFNGLDLPYRGGMRVLKVRPGSSAAARGVQEDDILVRLHRWTTTSNNDIRRIVNNADALASSGSVKFYIVRDGKTYFEELAVRSQRSVRR